MIIVASLIFLVIGIVIGFFASRIKSNSTPESDLEDELERSRQELGCYQDQVFEHFNQTAELLNGMANNYQELHHHMVSQSRQLLGESAESISTFPELPRGRDDDDSITMPPPKDYAQESSGILTGRSDAFK